MPDLTPASGLSATAGILWRVTSACSSTTTVDAVIFDWGGTLTPWHTVDLKACWLAGMAGCTRQPPEQILPYVRQPENVVPGRPLFYATAMTLGGRATGLLVESHEGRPTKIEGNPSHPASLGATDAFAQAALLDLYDPDRMRTLTQLGEIFPWSAFIGAPRARAAPAATSPSPR